MAIYCNLREEGKMETFIEKVIFKLWDAQVKPHNECKNSQEKIDRLEERRSGRIVRSVVAGALSLPLLVLPVLPSVISAVDSFSKSSGNDNPLNKDMVPVPQIHGRAEVNDSDFDSLKTLGKTGGVILGAGLACFAFVRANGARKDSKSIEEILLDRESHYHRTGRSPL
jgi:hypothetical protein